MSRKTFWIIAVVAVFLVPAATIAYWMFPRWERIPDVTKTSELVLHPRKHQKQVYAIDIYVSGQIEGTAELVWLEAGKPHPVLKFSGTVRAHFMSDWYADEVLLVYRPIRVTGGSLKLRYRFLPWYPTESVAANNPSAPTAEGGRRASMEAAWH
ncbi:MAG TPA: hypothetical protein VGO61_05135 [Steroidobacteraceae bacterium]|jgi:hypothetical protein|nr:hypothetical protein [Steroidobacteraceae bacterium]